MANLPNAARGRRCARAPPLSLSPKSTRRLGQPQPPGLGMRRGTTYSQHRKCRHIPHPHPSVPSTSIPRRQFNPRALFGWLAGLSGWAAGLPPHPHHTPPPPASLGLAIPLAHRPASVTVTATASQSALSIDDIPPSPHPQFQKYPQCSKEVYPYYTSSFHSIALY